MASSGGNQRLGPVKSTGPTRSLHTGSVRKRCPSISSRMVEWPSQVTRSPEGGGDAKRPGSTGMVLGGDWGFTLGFDFDRLTTAAQVSFTTGWGFSKCEPCHSGDFFIRWSRAPVARPPRGAQCAMAPAATIAVRPAAISHRPPRRAHRILRFILLHKNRFGGLLAGTGGMRCGVRLRPIQDSKVVREVVAAQRDVEIAVFGLHFDLQPRIGQAVRIVRYP